MHLASSSEDSTSRSQLYIGAALTFSGGTFLFVAMHALEDVTDSPGPDAGEGGHAAHRHDHEDHGDHPHAHPDESDWVRKPVRILLLLIGAIVPKSLQILTGGHQH
jgi:solute carrier family 39 (zinc transporter), member 9